LNTLLLRFVATASLARLTNEGLAIALVLIAEQRMGSTREAGVLVAASTFPQLATGPLLGPVVDRSPRPWALLRLAGVVTAAAAVLLATTVARGPVVVPLLGAFAMAGVEPLLNGGVSAIAGRGTWSTRVFAWDSLAYNVAGLGGPAVVTIVAIVVSPTWALVVLGLGAAAIAVTSLGLTTADAPHHGARVPGRCTIAAAIRSMATDAELRGATLASTVGFAALGGLSFALVAAAQATGRQAADAGIALTVSAVGGLVGSLLMTRRRPPRRR
jgi:MFS family permease